MSKWFENKNVRIAGIVVGSVAVLVAVFYLGVLVGARAFRPAGPGPFAFFRLLSGHGAIGVVTKIQGNLITMTDRDGQTQTVSVSSSTLIEVGKARHQQIQDIHVGDHIVVIGSPQANIIQARVIRVDRSAAPPTNTPLRIPFFGGAAAWEGRSQLND